MNDKLPISLKAKRDRENIADCGLRIKNSALAFLIRIPQSTIRDGGVGDVRRAARA
ncbi:MAG TPA: hypothetical protein VF708_14630 [Pyrinomonadaceae bacterium]|jgi:hypothetical protein